MDAHTLAKLTGASALRGLTGRFSPVRGTGPYAYRISITPTFLQLKPYALTLHSITVRGTGNDSKESFGIPLRSGVFILHGWSSARLLCKPNVLDFAGCCSTVMTEHVICVLCILRILRSYIVYTVRSGTVRWLLAYFLCMLVRLQLLWWPDGLLQVDSLCLANLC